MLRWMTAELYRIPVFDWPFRCFFFQIRNVNLFKKEQFNPDFIKLNPQHTVPTLDDNGFILSESRAIAIYLVEKYFPGGHSLYPKDAKTRAIINQRLQFDCGTLYQRIRAVAVSGIHFSSIQSKGFLSSCVPFYIVTSFIPWSNANFRRKSAEAVRSSGICEFILGG